MKDNIQECEKQVAKDEFEQQQNTTMLRSLRSELAVLKRKGNMATTNQETTMQEADDLRESLNERQPDSGRVLAYQEAIDVMTSMT